MYGYNIVIYVLTYKKYGVCTLKCFQGPLLSFETSDFISDFDLYMGWAYKAMPQNFDAMHMPSERL